MKIGYARVSTTDQNLARQIEALSKAGVKKIFREKESGAKIANRLQLVKMLKFIRESDTVYVQSLDRLGRNSKDLSLILQRIKDAGANFQSLDLPDFSAVPDENLRNMLTNIVLTVCQYLAEQERQAIRERQAQGIKLAKERGVYHGRPVLYCANSRNSKYRHAYNEIVEYLCNGWTISQIHRELGVSNNTIYRIRSEINANKK